MFFNKLHRVSTEYWLPIELAKVWEFYSSIENLARVTHPSLKVDVVSRDELTKGAEFHLQWSLAHLPMKVDWHGEYVEVDQGRDRCVMVDVLRRGYLFSYWKHKHVFEAAQFPNRSNESGQSGGTWVRDEVKFKMPVLSAPIFRSAEFARKQIVKILNYRKKKIMEILVS